MNKQGCVRCATCSQYLQYKCTPFRAADEVTKEWSCNACSKTIPRKVDKPPPSPTKIHRCGRDCCLPAETSNQGCRPKGDETNQEKQMSWLWKPVQSNSARSHWRSTRGRRRVSHPWKRKVQKCDPPSSEQWRNPGITSNKRHTWKQSHQNHPILSAN